MFTPIPGEMIQSDEHIFQSGWFNHQLVVCVFPWFWNIKVFNDPFFTWQIHGYFLESTGKLVDLRKEMYVNMNDYEGLSNN